MEINGPLNSTLDSPKNHPDAVIRGALTYSISAFVNLETFICSVKIQVICNHLRSVHIACTFCTQDLRFLLSNAQTYI